MGAVRAGLAAGVGGAELGTAERVGGAGLTATGWAGACVWLTSTLTPAITAATAITPPRTVIDVRKLISSIRAYNPLRKRANRASTTASTAYRAATANQA